MCSSSTEKCTVLAGQVLTQIHILILGWMKQILCRITSSIRFSNACFLHVYISHSSSSWWTSTLTVGSPRSRAKLKFCGGGENLCRRRQKNFWRRTTYFSVFSQFLRHFSVAFLIFFGIFNTVFMEILSVFHNVYKPWILFLSSLPSYIISCRVFRQCLYIGYLDLHYWPYNMTLKN